MKKLILFFALSGMLIALHGQCSKSKSSCCSKKSKNYSKTSSKAKKNSNVNREYYRNYQGRQNTRQERRASAQRNQARHNRHRTERRSNANHHRNRRSVSKDRLMLMVGGGPSYTLDPAPASSGIPKGEETTSGLSWNPQMLSGFGNAFLGYRFDMKGNKKANVFGVWGTAGLLNSHALERVLYTQEVVQVPRSNSQNSFTELEAGFLLKEWFRVSGGLGQQSFTNLGGERIDLRYNIATLGLNVPLGKTLVWQTSASMLFGKDFQKASFRPATGLALRFGML